MAVKQTWRRKELEAVHWLRAHGYEVDHKAASSRGLADILAFGSVNVFDGSRLVRPVFLVQVKYIKDMSTQWRGPDWKRATSIPWPDHVRPLFLVFVRGRKEPILNWA